MKYFASSSTTDPFHCLNENIGLLIAQKFLFGNLSQNYGKLKR
uniref:Uncharacterized protein n=1 Tax=Meloidogyne enterolobii TaxID=390850 RepID=A0A6V7W696_MELEN|nr:unnamed protein product [Meloidogyne enterolobii]